MDRRFRKSTERGEQSRAAVVPFAPRTTWRRRRAAVYRSEFDHPTTPFRIGAEDCSVRRGMYDPDARLGDSLSAESVDSLLVNPTTRDCPEEKRWTEREEPVR